MDIGDRITKDGRPGTVVGWGDGEMCVDILLDDGRETYCRLPDYGKRLKVIKNESPWDEAVAAHGATLRELRESRKAAGHPAWDALFSTDVYHALLAAVIAYHNAQAMRS